jgi:predicted nucleic acid-binding protein
VARWLIDTDVFVDHLRGARKLRPEPHRVAYSVITRCELYAGKHVDEDVVSLLLSAFEEIGVDRRVAESAGRVRRATGIRTPDALIAATALEHGCTLVTRNERDFRAVKGLRVRVPA